MREILFRGKRIDNGEWVYGFYVKTQDYYTQDVSNAILSADGNHYGFGEYTFETYNEIDASTLGQYTGLKDKNGTKIFEGDIVKLTRTNMYAPTTSFHNQDLISLHRVFWNSQKHCFYQEHFDIDKKRVTGGGILDFNDERAKQNIIEVVGNIYDNPELLGGENEINND